MGPLIVLKRIEGVSWREVMSSADEVLSRFFADDLLEFNIGILMQVCRAVHFAHSRGILHRDIKPSNVMIGSFGEVYLLDWGIAVALRDNADGRFQLAADARGLAGTPCYMSPEMLDPNYAELSEQTDIYLLGSVLYEVLMGRPPHAGDDVADLLCSIIESRPAFDERVPEELQRIAMRAMDPLPNKRFESAEELRLALVLFLKHRQAARLTSEARSRFVELSALLAAPEVARERVYKLFGECRFGLQEARRGWPDNDETRALADELFAKTIDYELTSDNAAAAATLLGEMEDAPPELRARVEEAVAAEQHKRAELTRLQRDLDPRIGRRTRRAVSVGMGVVWTLAPLLTNLVEPAHTASVVTLVPPVLLLLLAIGLWIGARESLSQTAINRRIMVAILVGFCAHMVHVLATQLAGLPPHSELAMGMVSFGAITAILAHTAESRLWPLVPLYWLGALAAAVRRNESAYILSGCNLLLTLYLFGIWRPERPVSPKD
jgi:serine/threonine-protein kinase